MRKHVESLHADLIYATKGLKNSNSDPGSKQVALIDRKSLDFEKKIQLCSILKLIYFIGKNKKTLLLDLDDTLVHTCSLFESPKHILTINLPEGAKTVDYFFFFFFFTLFTVDRNKFETFLL